MAKWDAGPSSNTAAQPAEQSQSITHLREHETQPQFFVYFEIKPNRAEKCSARYTSDQILHHSACIPRIGVIPPQHFTFGRTCLMITVRNEEMRSLGYGPRSVWNFSTKKKKKKENPKSWRACQQGTLPTPGAWCDLHLLALWPRLHFCFRSPVLFTFLLRRISVCTSPLKLAGLSKTTGWPLSWGNETTNFCGWEGPACVSSSHRQCLAGWRTRCYVPPGAFFSHGAWARWQNSFERDLYTGTQNC